MKTKVLLISPYDYRIHYDDNLSKAANVLGVCQSDDNIIIIDPTSARMVQKETLLHEAMHAMWNQTALDGIYSDEQEEQVVFTLTPRIVALLRDNPAFVKELME